MKVIGTGAPVVVTLWLEPCEVAVLREELEREREARSEHVATLCAGLTNPEANPDAQEQVREVERLQRLIRRLPSAGGSAQDTCLQLVAPMASIRSAVRASVGRAIERLSEAHETRDPAGLLSAAEAARACAQTFADLEHVETFGLREQGDLDDIDGDEPVIG